MPGENTDSGDATRRAIETRPGPLELVVPAADGVRIVRLRQGTSVLGRSRNADISVDAEGVSRRHLELRVSDSRLEARDLGSTNGSSVGDAALAADRWLEIPAGSVLRAGSAYLLVRPALAAPPPARSTSEPRRVILAPAMIELDQMVTRVASTTLPVVILGETGVGKEGIAAEIHARSARASKPFLKINCAAIAESILDSELFGHERGAFTGALQAKAGLFESADGGTVFLDEVGDMPQSTQAKLLRVLENGEILRLGARAAKRVDIRCVAATNLNLQRAVHDGEFRGDLFFRLSGMVLRIPPLRERPTEILPLVRLFVERAAMVMGLEPPELSDQAASLLTLHDWPGNVRELKNTVERALVLAGGGVIRGKDIVVESTEPVSPPPTRNAPAEAVTSEVLLTQPVGATPSALDAGLALTESLRIVERGRVIDALSRAGGNQRVAAAELGVSRHTLMKRMETFGIPRPKKRP